MENDLGITPDDLFRLSEMICSMAKRQGCTISETIDRLEVNSADHSHIPDAVSFARTAKHFRLNRDRVFGVSLFRDPAWDMLLDLLISEADNRPVSISSLCLGSGVPATTALRYLERLEQCGFIVRNDDRHDLRRSFVELVDERKEELRQFLAQWCREAFMPRKARSPSLSFESTSSFPARPISRDPIPSVFLS